MLTSQESLPFDSVVYEMVLISELSTLASVVMKPTSKMHRMSTIMTAISLATTKIGGYLPILYWLVSVDNIFATLQHQPLTLLD